MRVKRPSLLVGLGEGSSLVARIADALRQAIRARGFSAGDAIPSSRDLAKQLGVARNSILAAISQLVDEGLLETRFGAGTFVRSSTDIRRVLTPGVAASPDLSPWALRLPDRGSIQRNAVELLDLRPGLPDLNAIPFDEWRRSAMRKFRTSRTQLASYGDPQGHAALRVEIAKYVMRSRGVSCDADDVMITNGAQQAFDLIARVLVRPGATVAVEDPGYPFAAQAFAAVGAVVCGVTVDAEGLDVARIPSEATLVYTTPSHQFPLGVTLSDDRRRALLKWASDRRTLIVEDDYDSEYRFMGNALPALQGGDPDGRVIYVGTFSKSLMPGIRLGYMIVPRRIQRIFIDAKHISDAHSENITQAVLAEFMSSGSFNRHVRRMQSLYAERHEILMLHQTPFEASGSRLLSSQGGLHACLLLPPHRHEGDLIQAAADAGIAFCGLQDFFVSAPRSPGLVLGFGNIDTSKLSGALGHLLGLLRREPFPT